MSTDAQLGVGSSVRATTSHRRVSRHQTRKPTRFPPLWRMRPAHVLPIGDRNPIRQKLSASVSSLRELRGGVRPARWLLFAGWRFQRCRRSFPRADGRPNQLPMPRLRLVAGGGAVVSTVDAIADADMYNATTRHDTTRDGRLFTTGSSLIEGSQQASGRDVTKERGCAAECLVGGLPPPTEVRSAQDGPSSLVPRPWSSKSGGSTNSLGAWWPVADDGTVGRRG